MRGVGKVDMRSVITTDAKVVISGVGAVDLGIGDGVLSGEFVWCRKNRLLR